MKQKWLKPAVAGLIGFVVISLARALAIIVELQAFGLVGGRSLSLVSKLTLYAVVPLLVVIGAALTARLLGARVSHSIVIGSVAAATAIIIELSHNNYAPFDRLETAAFIAAALITATLAAASRQFNWKNALLSGLLGIGLILVAALTTGLGFVISLVAWLTLPVVSTTVQ